jgi:ParB/RepB/Spo0J family partition protein
MSAPQVHPVADLFPMLADDELAELAADIGQRGLLHPIVLDAEGRILDGRNRWAACKIAKVEPATVVYEGEDPDGYALAVNIARRHLTKGQQAMIAARAIFVSNNLQHSAANSLGLSQSRIAYAVTVRDHAPDMVDAVIAGATGLDEAYRIARDRKTAADSVEAQLARLRSEDPELASKVVEGDLTLAGARAELVERQRKRAEEERDARALLVRIVDLAAPAGMSAGFVDSWVERLVALDPELIKRTEQAGRVLLDLAERTKQ